MADSAPNQLAAHRTLSAPQPTRRLPVAVAWLLVWTLFLSMSFVRAPIPAVNEPHYLGKAKYWWNPEWCAGDFFLASSNPHAVFYVTVGWLTRWLSLPQTALVARVVSLGLLAGGWVAFTSMLFARRGTAVVTAAVFCLLMAVGNFSGEWLIGGVESKVFAYACALWSAAFLLGRRMLPAALLAVLAVAFHAVAGMWILVATVMAAVLAWRLCFAAVASSDAASPRQLPGSRAARAIPVLIVTVGTLIALLPALPLLMGVDPQIAREADRLLLTQRVGHHTDPLLFPERGYIYYGGLLLCWLCAVVVGGRRLTPALRGWQWFVASSLLIALVGLIVGWLPKFTPVDRLAAWRLWLLKFYPFRLADLALPMAVAIALGQLLEWFGEVEHSRGGPGVESARHRLPVPWLTAIVTAAAWLGMLMLPAPDANSSGMTPQQQQDWIAVCHWLRDHTPPRSLIACANEEWALKWYAERPEYVNFKDCPQDAQGVVDWWARRQELVRWSKAAKADGVISLDDLADLQQQTGIDYLVVSRYGPISPPPTFSQGAFRVYATRR